MLPRLIPYWLGGHTRYFEPFAGSAALFFALAPERALLSDVNRELIDALTAIRDEPDAVFDTASAYITGKAHYYRLRNVDSRCLDTIGRAARFVYLNRYCFNGIYRTNGAGKFNVPFAPTGTGGLPDRTRFRSAARLLGRAGGWPHV
ncbi:MAG: DNA adenine methylase [Acidobacteriia bacterium]|nr:DNA adenine methylase [Terriglobia bacterium]